MGGVRGCQGPRSRGCHIDLAVYPQMSVSESHDRGGVRGEGVGGCVGCGGEIIRRM